MSRPLMETYHGLVRTPVDAIKLFEACRLGILPRVQRRLSEKERQAIRSGSVFVWDEREAGMRRWTDGKSWSASRVSGSFLTYREMEGKRYREMEGKRGAKDSNQRRGAGRTPDSGRGSDEDQDDGEPGGYRYKADGLMKQSFSITTSNGQHLHLISYFTKSHSQSSELPEPSTDPQLRSIVPPKGLYPESSWNDSSSLPALTRVPMTGPGQYMMAQQQYPPHQYAPAPQHQHHQQPQGYTWPLSPVATPPYATNGGHSQQQHYTTSPYPPHSQPHHGHHQPPPSQHQPQAQPPPPPPSNYPTQYSTNRLPPPAALLQQSPQPQQQQQPPPPPPPHHSPHAQYAQYQPRPQYQPPPRVESPRSAHLQAAAAQAVLNAARNPQPTPPMLHASTVTRTPPNRALSVSPPRSSHSEATSIAASTAASSLGSTNKASLSALLHPTPSNSEPGSANPGTGSAGSSPRGMDNMGLSEDVRAIRVLDRNFGL